ncbi:MAG TPA: hypothetical protein VGO09_01395 [Flavisolibacter sp.]|jgi:hypothetical protein|nr:hypothetical protein [Flavisolibacter sp.]
MKNILIAAAIVGAATAGAILYLKNRNNNRGSDRIKGAAKDAYNTMNSGIGKVERLGQHSMG